MSGRERTEEACGRLGETGRYQWRKDGAVLSGASASGVVASGTVACDAVVRLPFAMVGTVDAARYELELGNSIGTTVSGALMVAVNAKPRLVVAPKAQVAAMGGVATFRMEAGGVGPLAYTWYRNGEELAGETASALSLANLTLADHNAAVKVRVSNRLSSMVSDAVACR